MGSHEHTWHVLVVDDDDELRVTLQDLLVAEGFDVQIASDGVEALSMLEHRGAYDAVVCDLAMPRLDGNGLVRALRRRGMHQVIVLLSGHFDLLAEAADLGHVYAIGKPFTVDSLVQTLKDALEERV